MGSMAGEHTLILSFLQSAYSHREGFCLATFCTSRVPINATQKFSVAPQQLPCCLALHVFKKDGVCIIPHVPCQVQERIQEVGHAAAGR